MVRFFHRIMAAPLAALLLMLPASTTGFSFKSPFLRSDPSLYAGRWKITSSNRVGNDLGDDIMVEIERPNTFRAIGYQDKKLENAAPWLFSHP